MTGSNFWTIITIISLQNTDKHWDTCFVLPDDPDYDEDRDNILVELSTCVVPTKLENKEWGIADGNNHNTLHGLVKCSMVDEFHCYLYHSLYDHTDLGWINMLRIGMIWVDIKVQYQKFFEI